MEKGLIYLAIFLITTFFTLWVNVKFIKDSSGVDQYWHKVQFYQQVWTWIAFGLFVVLGGGNAVQYAILAFGYGLCYMFLYNTSLNIMRGILDLGHLNPNFDLPFKKTLLLFFIGLIIIILELIF